MKLNGIRPPLYIKTLVLPRGDDQEPVVLKAKALQNMDEFEKYSPVPLPPEVRGRGDTKTLNWSDPGYLIQVRQQNARHTDFVVIRSLEATEGLEWERVKLEDANTWGEWRKEMEEAGFGLFEIQRIISLCIEVNSLSDQLLDEAQKRFLAGQAKAT